MTDRRSSSPVCLQSESAPALPGVDPDTLRAAHGMGVSADELRAARQARQRTNHMATIGDANPLGPLWDALVFDDIRRLDGLDGPVRETLHQCHRRSLLLRMAEDVRPSPKAVVAAFVAVSRLGSNPTGEHLRAVRRLQTLLTDAAGEDLRNVGPRSV